MGKASQRKAQRRGGERALTRREHIRAAQKADNRGRNVEPTESGYSAAGQQGASRVVEAMIARHNVRMTNGAQIPEPLADVLLSALAPITTIDISIRSFRRDSETPLPGAWYRQGGWVELVDWASDSCVGAVRLALMGQFVGAAAILRQQVERWTAYLGGSYGAYRAGDESIQDFIARAWSLHIAEVPRVRNMPTQSAPPGDLDEEAGRFETEEAPDDHGHLDLSDGTSICPGLTYGLLCSILHGETTLDGASRWNAAHLDDEEVFDPAVVVTVDLLADAVSLVLYASRIPLVAMYQASHEGVPPAFPGTLDRFSTAPASDEPPSPPNLTGRLGHLGRAVPPPEPLVRPAPISLMPLLPDQGLAPDVIESVRQSADLYERTLTGERVAGRLLRDDELVTLSFHWHRRRHLDQALAALDSERELRGDEFDLSTLTGRGVQVTVLCEVPALLSLWTDDPIDGASLAVMSSGLRSAFWLWLEDDDRAMAALRSVLEQVARLRTHRIKPDKAVRLETDSRTTPSDWLEAAGWRRMSPLLRALSEFAHGQESARWGGAWRLLASLQEDASDEGRETPAFLTARSHALEFVTRLMALELASYARHSHDEETAHALTLAMVEMNLSVEEQPVWLETKLNHIWDQRTTTFGTPDIHLPRSPSDEAAGDT